MCGNGRNAAPTGEIRLLYHPALASFYRAPLRDSAFQTRIRGACETTFFRIKKNYFKKLLHRCISYYSVFQIHECKAVLTNGN